jgi:hypothetical protein
MWEKVNWGNFDFVAINLYRASSNEKFFERNLKKTLAISKPVIISEFG